MAVDPGVRDAYVNALASERDRRGDELGRVKEQLKTAKLEQAAIAALPAATAATLQAAEVTGRLNLQDLQSRRDQLQLELAAIDALVDATKAAV